jgi:hypothetical protein
MSSQYWDFRNILDVNPDSYTFTCVGTTKKGTRCGNKRPFLATADLAGAARLLDTMDRSSRLKSSYQYLEELADFCLCKRWHRGAQTAQVVRRWEYCITEYAEAIQKERRRAERIAAKQKLEDMKKIAMQLQDQLIEENKENVSCAKQWKLR